jgi:hypothetical protein
VGMSQVVRMAARGLAPVVLFGVACTASAATPSLRAQPVAAAPVQSRPALPTVQSPLAPAAVPGHLAPAAPGLAPLKPPALGRVSAATQQRLRNAGLDPADPGLAAKLRARLYSSGAQFRSAHLSAVRIERKQPQLGGSRVMSSGGRTGGATALAPRRNGAFTRLARPASSSKIMKLADITFVGMFDKYGKAIQKLDMWSMDAFALVSYPTDAFFGYPQDPDFAGTVTFSGACGINATNQNTWLIGGNGVGYANGPYSMNLTAKPDSGGTSYMYVEVRAPGFALGAQPRNMTITIRVASSTATSTTIPMVALPADATVDLTIDSAPPFVTANSFGIGSGNGVFASPGNTRLDPGTNPTASTSGDDMVGVGVNLGAGWTVASAKIVAAHSVLDAPNDSTPDDAYRGASVTQAPSAGRLQTGVHWHYGVAESLSYTIEWKLEGPTGQRPLMTMPLTGSCDS